MSDLHSQIVTILPDLKRYACSLTTTSDDADDLVHDCVERALRKTDLYETGTNLRAWMFTMMRNLFISSKRRQKVSNHYIDMAGVFGRTCVSPEQINRTFLAETGIALERLTVDEREAIRLLAVENRSHSEAAAAAGQPVGTMKSRLSRGRAKLRAIMMLGDLEPTSPSH
ncbi:MAG: sigma-70 family RNA polymerase sigma factor [Alphaproteobacteria bacterium]